jgi:hypothetical protein
LNYLQENSNVWLGAIWWGGGPVSLLPLNCFALKTLC